MEELLEESIENLSTEELLEKSTEELLEESMENLSTEELLEKSTEKPLEESTQLSGIELGVQTGEVFPEVEDICDQCQGEAHVFCKQCNNSYCTTCSIQRYRIGKRKEHFVARLSKLITFAL